jgi:hypothetical protein
MLLPHDQVHLDMLTMNLPSCFQPQAPMSVAVYADTERSTMAQLFQKHLKAQSDFCFAGRPGFRMAWVKRALSIRAGQGLLRHQALGRYVAGFADPSFSTRCRLMDLRSRIL